MPGLDLTKISSNWKALQAQLKSERTTKDDGLKKRKRADDHSTNSVKRPRAERPRSKPGNARSKMGSYISSEPRTVDAAVASHADLRKNHDISTNDLSAAYGGFFELSAKDIVNDGRHRTHKAGKYLALDCEMVGTGPPPHSDDVLARVSIVNFHGEQIYDSYVQPIPGIKVQDYRTHVSGIREEHMRPGTARPFSEVQREVANLLDGRILVGHALKKDLQALQLNHSQRDTRDTSRHAAFRVESRGKPPALRNLARTHLGVTIQAGAHSSLEDARATMLLYKKEKSAFEEESRRLYGTRSAPRKVVSKPVEVEQESEDEDDEDESVLLEGEYEDGDRGTNGSTSHVNAKKKRKKKKRTKR